jgi:soluble lytic murein transglycosylase-like protein
MVNKLIYLVIIYSTICLGSPEINVIYKAALKNHVDKDVLYGICKVESNLDPSAMHHNDGGEASIGLCQVKLSTARSFGFKGDSKTLSQPGTNAYYAARYLRFLYNKYHNWDHAIAAYNLGHLKLNKRGLIWNRSYVKKVKLALQDLQLAQD